MSRYFFVSATGNALSGLAEGSTRSDSVAIRPTLCSGACSRSPEADLCTAYCQTLIEPLATSILAMPPAFLPSTWARSSSDMPITISSFWVMILNRKTLSAARAGWITTLSMMRQATPRPSSRRLDMCIRTFLVARARGKRRKIIRKTPRDQLLVARGGKCVRGNFRLFRLQLQCGRVDAVAQAGRARAVVEDVAAMALALRAQHLRAD